MSGITYRREVDERAGRCIVLAESYAEAARMVARCCAERPDGMLEEDRVRALGALEACGKEWSREAGEQADTVDDDGSGCLPDVRDNHALHVVGAARTAADALRRDEAGQARGAMMQAYRSVIAFHRAEVCRAVQGADETDADALIRLAGVIRQTEEREPGLWPWGHPAVFL